MYRYSTSDYIYSGYYNIVMKKSVEPRRKLPNGLLQARVYQQYYKHKEGFNVVEKNIRERTQTFYRMLIGGHSDKAII